MRAIKNKGNSTRVIIMLYFFILTVGFMFPKTNVIAQSVSVDYCVLENLGTAPNVPSTLLGKAASRHISNVCANKTLRNSVQSGTTQLSISNTYQPSFKKISRAPRFPIIRNGRFVPPAGQIGFTSTKKKQDLSLLSPPTSKKKRISRKKVSQSSKFSATKKTPSRSKLPQQKTKASISVSKLNKILSTDTSRVKKVRRKQEIKNTATTTGPAAPRVPNAPIVDKQKKNLSKFSSMPVSKIPNKKTSAAVAALEPGISKTESIRQIKFAVGSAKIETDSELSLKEVSKKLNSDPTLRIQLMAYASIDGKSESQARRLSLSRALAVRSRLIGAGIRSTRIDVRALGSRVNGGKANRVDLLLKKR